jgi:hypothetical protein
MRLGELSDDLLFGPWGARRKVEDAMIKLARCLEEKGEESSEAYVATARFRSAFLSAKYWGADAQTIAIAERARVLGAWVEDLRILVLTGDLSASGYKKRSTARETIAAGFLLLSCLQPMGWTYCIARSSFNGIEAGGLSLLAAAGSALMIFGWTAFSWRARRAVRRSGAALELASNELELCSFSA